MKKLGIFTIILVLLSVLAIYLYRGQQKSAKGIISPDRDFTVESMDEINKIVIKHVKLQPLVFTRNGQNWKLNGKYNVDPAVFINIEKVLTKAKMLYIPPAAASATIKKSIENNGIQVDLYHDDPAPFKIFFIGADTQDSDGTFMIMGGAQQPYAMHLPGLAGGLRSRFEQPEINFRDKFIFKDKAENIESIKVEYPKDLTSSFVILKTDNEMNISATSAQNIVPAIPPSGKLLNSYVSQFEALGAEAIFNNLPQKDTITSMIPNCVLELKSKNGILKKCKFFAYDDFVEKTGNARSPEEIRSQNRMFVLVNDTDFYVVQNRVFGNIFRGYQEFFKTTPVVDKN
ncbi:MAG: hypothetical protein IPL08_10240 [Saprospiraceae bacterium]|nr:hypothetical protein [Saprospiraceae bacterium]